MVSSKTKQKVSKKKTVKIADIKKELEGAEIKFKDTKDFIFRLENTLKFKKKERDQLEGAILTLKALLKEDKSK